MRAYVAQVFLHRHFAVLPVLLLHTHAHLDLPYRNVICIYYFTHTRRGVSEIHESKIKEYCFDALR